MPQTLARASLELEMHDGSSPPAAATYLASPTANVSSISALGCYVANTRKKTTDQLVAPRGHLALPARKHLSRVELAEASSVCRPV